MNDDAGRHAAAGDGIERCELVRRCHGLQLSDRRVRVGAEAIRSDPSRPAAPPFTLTDVAKNREVPLGGGGGFVTVTVDAGSPSFTYAGEADASTVISEV
jgi:hypothetical protein